MKHILLPKSDENIKYYRANLHCHSTISDGRKTPQQLKEDYMKHGYSIIAYTDHEIFVCHNDLTDESFLALNGYELSVNEEAERDCKTCHMCLIALDKNNHRDACYHRTKYISDKAAKYREALDVDETEPDFERVYTPECINEMFCRSRESGFFVTYNHPVWSLEGYMQYMGYHGMNALEINNFSSIINGWDDDDGHCYEDMLKGGERIFCIATDDNHNGHPDTDPSCDSYGGYTVIASPSLKYENVTEALVKGQFYSSTGNYAETGPEILSLTYEDGKVRIETSGVRNIQIMHDTRCAHAKNAPVGEYINSAELEVDGNAEWFRLVVTDRQGFKAYTNAYFIDELD